MGIFAKTVSFAVNGRSIDFRKEAVEFSGVATSIIFNSYRAQSIYIPAMKVVLDCEEDGAILSGAGKELYSEIKEALLAGLLDQLSDRLLESCLNASSWDDS